MRHRSGFVRVSDKPSSIGTGRRELGSVELGCQDRWLVGLPTHEKRIHLGPLLPIKRPTA